MHGRVREDSSNRDVGVLVDPNREDQTTVRPHGLLDIVGAVYRGQAGPFLQVFCGNDFSGASWESVMAGRVNVLLRLLAGALHDDAYVILVGGGAADNLGDSDVLLAICAASKDLVANFEGRNLRGLGDQPAAFPKRLAILKDINCA